MSIRVLLIDDHALIRKGIVTTLSQEADVEVVGTGKSGYEVLSLCEEFTPDVLLLDYAMPGPPPGQTVTSVRNQFPDTKIIILTAHNDKSYIHQMISLGVSGYLLKEEALTSIVQAIRTVEGDGKWFSQLVLHKFVDASSEAESPDMPQLTARELDLLRMLADGDTDTEIGHNLGLARRTVRHSVRALCDKLGVNSRIELIVRAIRWGFVE